MKVAFQRWLSHQVKIHANLSLTFLRSDGHLLVSVGNDNMHTLAVWRWQDKKMIASSTVSTSPVQASDSPGWNFMFKCRSIRFDSIPTCRKQLECTMNTNLSLVHG